MKAIAASYMYPFKFQVALVGFMHSEVLKLNPMTSMYCAPGDVEACGIKNGMPGWHVSEMSHHGTHPPFATYFAMVKILPRL